MPEQAKKTDERVIDVLIENIFDALPASSYEEIAARLTKSMRRKVSAGYVGMALAHLRANPEDYVYTVPHVKRGPGKKGEEERFRAVLAKADGSFDYKDFQKDFIAGLISTVGTLASMGKNEAVAMRETADYDKTTVRKALIKELADDLEYVSRKAVALLSVIKKKAA